MGRDKEYNSDEDDDYSPSDEESSSSSSSSSGSGLLEDMVRKRKLMKIEGGRDIIRKEKKIKSAKKHKRSHDKKHRHKHKHKHDHDKKHKHHRRVTDDSDDGESDDESDDDDDDDDEDDSDDGFTVYDDVEDEGDAEIEERIHVVSTKKDALGKYEAHNVKHERSRLDMNDNDISSGEYMFRAMCMDIFLSRFGDTEKMLSDDGLKVFSRSASIHKWCRRAMKHRDDFRGAVAELRKNIDPLIGYGKKMSSFANVLNKLRHATMLEVVNMSDLFPLVNGTTLRCAVSGAVICREDSTSGSPARSAYLLMFTVDGNSFTMCVTEEVASLLSACLYVTGIELFVKADIEKAISAIDKTDPNVFEHVYKFLDNDGKKLVVSRYRMFMRFVAVIVRFLPSVRVPKMFDDGASHDATKDTNKYKIK